MKQYSYLCIGHDGQEVSGFLYADSDESARIRLMEQGLKVIRVDFCDSDESNEVASETDEVAEITEFEAEPLAGYGKSVWNTEPEYLDSLRNSPQFQIQGLPLSASLRTLAEESPSISLARTFQKMARELEQGRTAEETFEKHLPSVPQNLSALIRVAANTDKLESVIEDYLESERLLRQSRHKLSVSFFYSALFFCGAFLLFYFLMTIVLASFRTLFEDFGTELPRLTTFMLGISEILTDYGFQIIFTMLGCILLFWFSFDLLRMRALRRRILNRIPIFGGILSSTSISQFCRIMAGLIDARVKLPEALTLAAQLTRDPNLIAGCKILIKRCNAGFSLMESAQSSPHFTKSFVHIFRWQDRPQVFVESLRASSNIYQAKANLKTGTLIFILQPVMIASMLFLLGLPIVAIYLPMIKLLNDLS